MTTTLQLLLAVGLGIGSALQFSMLGAMGRLRGPTEATWLSLLGSVTGIAVVLMIRALRGDELLLPTPFDRTLALAAVTGLATGALVSSVRGLDPYFALTGLLATAFLVGTAFLVPRIGVGLFFAALTLGSLAGAVLLDHLGAFGAEPQHVNALRLTGIAVVAVGMILVRASN